MVKAMVGQCAKDLKSFRVGQGILAGRQLSASRVRIESSCGVNDRSVCWDFCSSNTPSLRGRFGDLMTFDLAKSSLGTVDSRDIANADSDSGSP